jgi:hypothetical protein
MHKKSVSFIGYACTLLLHHCKTLHVRSVRRPGREVQAGMADKSSCDDRNKQQVPAPCRRNSAKYAFTSFFVSYGCIKI